MVSQGSFCDSDCVPGYMQEGPEDDVGLFEVASKREVEDFPFLGRSMDDTEMRPKPVNEIESPGDLGFSGVGLGKGILSSPGDIPLKEGLVVDGSSSEGEDEEADTIQLNSNPAVRAAFDINKQEREELISLRFKMTEVQNFMKRKGLSMVDLESSLLSKNESFNSGSIRVWLVGEMNLVCHVLWKQQVAQGLGFRVSKTSVVSLLMNTIMM